MTADPPKSTGHEIIAPKPIKKSSETEDELQIPKLKK